MSTKPISPDEIKIELPEFVIQGINAAIQEKYRGGSFTVKQNEIMDFIMQFAPEGFQRSDLGAKGYLDFEELYESYGWKVKYDRPGFNENYYDPYFEFIPKTKS